MKKNENYKTEYKIITLGDSGVGKTAILKRFAHNTFEKDNMSTIGFSIVFKEITLKNKEKVNLKLIDTAGQERYRSVGKNYYRNVNGALFVFSHNNKESFEHIENWKNLFEENTDDIKIPIFLIGNKNDLPKFNEEENSFEDYIKEHNILRYISTSAKDNINITQIFEEMAEIIDSKNNNKSVKQKHKVLKPNIKKGGCCSPDV